MKAKKIRNHFIVTYKDPKDGTILTLKAGKIHDSSLGLGFISISEFMFDDQALVIHPDQEALQKRLEGVEALHISIYSVLSVQEIGSSKQGLRFRKSKSNLVVLPKP